MPARDPSRLSQFALGYSRLGVYRAGYWETAFKPIAQLVTWRVANINVDRDSTTGHRIPSYSLTHDIYGVFEWVAGEKLELDAGFVQTGDAVFTCFDNVVPMDQIYLPESNQYFEVATATAYYEQLTAPNVTSFKYRRCNLHLLPFYAVG